MLKFREITLEDQGLFEKLLPMDPAFMSERTFVSLYVWSNHYKIKMCYFDDILFICSDYYKDYLLFFPPFTMGDYKKAISYIKEYSSKTDLPIKFNTVSQFQKEFLEQLYGNEAFIFTPNRASFDYIYSAEDLMWLKGKKYSAKRNHVNKFLGENGDDWSYEALDPVRDFDEVMAFQCEWCKIRGAENDGKGETCAIGRALKAYKELGMSGGILRVKGKIVAFSIGKRINEDRFAVLFEKAYADVNGAYPMINQQFAQHNFEGIKFVNREEDLGIEGLRKAKESYYPVELTTKYVVAPLIFSQEMGVAAGDCGGK